MEAKKKKGKKKSRVKKKKDVQSLLSLHRSPFLMNRFPSECRPLYTYRDLPKVACAVPTSAKSAGSGLGILPIPPAVSEEDVGEVWEARMSVPEKETLRRVMDPVA
jgi:hypothetical protein